MVYWFLVNIGLACVFGVLFSSVALFSVVSPGVSWCWLVAPVFVVWWVFVCWFVVAGVLLLCLVFGFLFVGWLLCCCSVVRCFVGGVVLAPLFFWWCSGSWCVSPAWFMLLVLVAGVVLLRVVFCSWFVCLAPGLVHAVLV